ncbi:hypothetical protein [Neptuniibacter sp. QD37_11]|uniref:hypothetical protein n=1 Tax=Neptuniibacter sp. QD37_11 TaxID=3398209 RepID=UPI0039F5D27C
MSASSFDYNNMHATDAYRHKIALHFLAQDEHEAEFTKLLEAIYERLGLDNRAEAKTPEDLSQVDQLISEPDGKIDWAEVCPGVLGKGGKVDKLVDSTPVDTLLKTALGDDADKLQPEHIQEFKAMQAMENLYQDDNPNAKPLVDRIKGAKDSIISTLSNDTVRKGISYAALGTAIASGGGALAIGMMVAGRCAKSSTFRNCMDKVGGKVSGFLEGCGFPMDKIKARAKDGIEAVAKKLGSDKGKAIASVVGLGVVALGAGHLSGVDWGEAGDNIVAQINDAAGAVGDTALEVAEGGTEAVLDGAQAVDGLVADASHAMTDLSDNLDDLTVDGVTDSTVDAVANHWEDMKGGANALGETIANAANETVAEAFKGAKEVGEQIEVATADGAPTEGVVADVSTGELDHEAHAAYTGGSYVDASQTAEKPQMVASNDIDELSQEATRAIPGGHIEAAEAALKEKQAFAQHMNESGNSRPLTSDPTLDDKVDSADQSSFIARPEVEGGSTTTSEPKVDEAVVGNSAHPLGQEGIVDQNEVSKGTSTYVIGEDGNSAWAAAKTHLSGMEGAKFEGQTFDQLSAAKQDAYISEMINTLDMENPNIVHPGQEIKFPNTLEGMDGTLTHAEKQDWMVSPSESANGLTTQTPAEQNSVAAFFKDKLGIDVEVERSTIRQDDDNSYSM